MVKFWKKRKKGCHIELVYKRIEKSVALIRQRRILMDYRLVELPVV